MNSKLRSGKYADLPKNTAEGEYGPGKASSRRVIRRETSRMVFQFFFSAILFTFLIQLLCGLIHSESGGSAVAVLDRNEVLAGGRNEVVLEVSEFGRYGITVKSETGVALQLSDYMSGPGEIHGEPGIDDGRLDEFLDRGEYLIITHGHEKAKGTARLTVQKFEPRYPEDNRILVEKKLIKEELEDFEAVSYWYEVKERKFFLAEAAGRRLSDLRMWKDGSWIFDMNVKKETVSPVSGRPLTLFQIWGYLEPGLYRLTAYGGPAQPWSYGDEDNPLYIRSGIRELGKSGRLYNEMEAFGTERLLVDGEADYYRLELPFATEATFHVMNFSYDSPFSLTGGSAVITKESREPAAELSLRDKSAAKKLITIKTGTGQSYILQYFESSESYEFKGDDEYFLATVHSGDPADNIDAGAIISRHRTGDSQYEIAASSTIELDRETIIKRRFNLFQDVELYLRVKETGKYGIHAEGTDARFRIEPFLIWYPREYSPPDYKPSETTWELDSGYYILTVDAISEGILEMYLYPATGEGEDYKNAAKGAALSEHPSGSAIFGDFEMDKGYTYKLHLNNRPGKTAVILRKTPIEMSDPLALTQRPGEKRSLMLRIEEQGMLEARTDEGLLLDISSNRNDWRKTLEVKPGKHEITINYTGEKTTAYSLSFTPLRLRADSPLPEIPRQTLESIPHLEALTENTPQYFDLVKNGSRTLSISVEEPALYRIESTGLLETEGILRTRTDPVMFSAAANGIGRNFLIQQYLNQGLYQITVRTLGESSGHSGIEMHKTNLIGKGALSPGTPARTTLPTGQAVEYGFNVAEKDDYRIDSFGIYGPVACRLEDDRGLPLIKPGRPAAFEYEFSPGDYRLILLPSSVETRTVTLIEPVKTDEIIKGHGPHVLPINEPVNAQWREPDTGDIRHPDIWEFEVPAAVEALIELTNGMAGLLKKHSEGDWTIIGETSSEDVWKKMLDKGKYRLETKYSRISDRIRYTLQVSWDELTAGLHKEISLPSVVDVAVGHSGLVELSSWGKMDVKARLFDSEGNQIGFNDDRPDDWNFLIVPWLNKGKYKLHVEPVGTEHGSCIVRYHEQSPEIENSIKLPFNQKLTLQKSPRVFPLQLNSSSNILVLTAKSAAALGLILETTDQNNSRSISGKTFGNNARLAIPLKPPHNKNTENDYFLRLWSLDHRPSEVSATGLDFNLKTLTEEDLEKGIKFKPLSLTNPDYSAFLIQLNRPGVFRVPEGLTESGIYWSDQVNKPCTEIKNELIAVQNPYLWIFCEHLDGRAHQYLRAERVFLDPSSASKVHLNLPAGHFALCDIEPINEPLLIATALSSGALYPGICITNRDQSEKMIPDIRKTDFGKLSSLSASFNNKYPMLLMWSAYTHKNKNLDVSIQLNSYSDLPSMSFSEGLNEGKIDSEGASFALPEGDKKLSLTLDDKMAAALTMDDGSIELVHTQKNERTTATAVTRASTLFLLKIDPSSSGRFSIDLHSLPAALPPTHSINLKQYFKYDFLHNGTSYIKAALPEGPEQFAKATLHIRGKVKAAELISPSGDVYGGLDMPLREGESVLRIDHESGSVLSWIEYEGESGLMSGSDFRELEGVRISEPGIYMLEGEAERYVFSFPKETALHIRASGGKAARFISARTETLDYYPDRFIIDRYLKEGEGELHIQATGSEGLQGTMEITASAVIPVTEELGPEVILGSGATRIFSFTVPDKRQIGIGIKAEPSNVSCRLQDDSGMQIGEGAVQMHELENGEYLLFVHAPAEGPAVWARPAVLGLTLPDTGPPDEVIKSYKKQEGGPVR